MKDSRHPSLTMKSFGRGGLKRISRVHVGGEPSSAGPVRSSLLFLIFVNDILDALKALVLLFADDANMVTRRTQKRYHSEISYYRMGLAGGIGPVD